jgi:hypothetical protein
MNVGQTCCCHNDREVHVTVVGFASFRFVLLLSLLRSLLRMRFAHNNTFSSLAIVSFSFSFLIFSITVSTSMSLFHPHPAGVPTEVENALQVVRRLLDQNKNPMAAADVDHEYGDKYSLVEFVTNTGIAAALNVLEQLDGFNEEILRQVLIVVKDQKRSMTLRLAVEEDCEFLEETKRTVESPTSHQLRVESDGTDGGGTPTNKTYTHKTLTEITEYHWKCGLRHTLILFAGTDPSMGIVLGTRTGTTRLVTTMKKHPYPPKTRSPIDLDLTFLIQQVDKESLLASFKIDREQAKTPRRNKQAEEALQFTDNLMSWLDQCLYYFQVTIWQELLGGKSDTCAEWLSKINATDVFAPVAPLFMEPSEELLDDTNETQMERHGLVSLPSPPAGPLISLKDTSLLLKEQTRSLTEVLMSLMGNFPDPTDAGQLVSGYEAKLVLLWLHLRDIASQWSAGINYVEQMLYNQLVTAVGKEVGAQDFQAFLKFHNARLMGKNYAPRPFCYAIRQPNQYPDGVLSITTKKVGLFGSTNDNRDADTIETFSHHIPGDTLVAPMLLPLNAATTVEFIGDQYLHGWVDTHFESCFGAGVEHFVCARARQFSCFLMLVGSISGPNEFTPKDAILLQNKDEVLIPLLTTALPSAKEFRDAVKSLSPEQARFAKSYRAMQLDSSVFGLCVIQVKPQMEALLNLPPNALTKEIQLTQDLLTLFAQYQVPPTLVSYDGNDAATMVEKVTAVKEHVKGVLDVVKSIKEEQLQEETRKAAMHKEKVMQTAQLDPARIRSPARAMRGDPFGGFSGATSDGLFGSAGACLEGSGIKQGSRIMQLASACNSAPGFAPPASTPASAPARTSAWAKSQPLDDGNDSVEFGESEGFDDLQDQFSDLDLRREAGDAAKAKGWMVPSLDFATIPKKLDRVFESFDKDGALRTMTIKTGDEWTRTRQENLLTKMETTKLTPNDKKTETNKALDLLDALSRSGSLPIASGELHVVIGVRHAFERNVMATVIEDNVNPIEKVDYTSLLIGSTVHQVDIPTLLANSAEPPNLVLKNRVFPPLMMGNTNDERQES